MRAALAVALAALLLCLGASSSTSSALGADDLVFSGLGSWVDIYDGPVYAAPERTATRIAARGVRPPCDGTSESQPSQVLTHRGVDECGGAAQLVGDPVHRPDVDPGAGKSAVSYSSIESHA